MQAAVYYGPRDIRVEDVPMPELAEDELLIRIKACGICGSALHMYRFEMFEALGRRIDNGRIMGHELSGVVVAVGPNVTGFRVGNRLAVGGSWRLRGIHLEAVIELTGGHSTTVIIQ